MRMISAEASSSRCGTCPWRCSNWSRSRHRCGASRSRHPRDHAARRARRAGPGGIRARSVLSWWPMVTVQGDQPLFTHGAVRFLTGTPGSALLIGVHHGLLAIGGRTPRHDRDRQGRASSRIGQHPRRAPQRPLPPAAIDRDRCIGARRGCWGSLPPTSTDLPEIARLLLTTAAGVTAYTAVLLRLEWPAIRRLGLLLRPQRAENRTRPNRPCHQWEGGCELPMQFTTHVTSGNCRHRHRSGGGCIRDGLLRLGIVPGSPRGRGRNHRDDHGLGVLGAAVMGTIGMLTTGADASTGSFRCSVCSGSWMR